MSRVLLSARTCFVEVEQCWSMTMQRRSHGGRQQRYKYFADLDEKFVLTTHISKNFLAHRLSANDTISLDQIFALHFMVEQTSSKPRKSIQNQTIRLHN